jgi:hypothetical protein
MKMLATSISVFLLMGAIAAQTSAPSDPAASSATVSVESRKTTIIIPAGTSVPVSLKQAISTKTARNGDPVYAETAFPCVVNGHIVIPSGTYIQGKIERVQRGGHVKGRAEVLIHFTSMIYPNGYTVMLGGTVENTPGADSTSMDSEGTIRQDSEAGRKAKAAAEGATTGAVIGAVTNGGKGAGIGAGVGGVTGLAIGMLSRGADVKLETGTSIQMEIQREVSVDASRISSRPDVVVRKE